MIINDLTSLRRRPAKTEPIVSKSASSGLALSGVPGSFAVEESKGSVGQLAVV